MSDFIGYPEAHSPTLSAVLGAKPALFNTVLLIFGIQRARLPFFSGRWVPLPHAT
jgi:hypothetical protein